MRSLLEQAVSMGQLRHIDLHAGLFLHGLADRGKRDLLLATVLASRAVGDGHICLPLEESAGRRVFGHEISLTAPELVSWRENLFASGMVGGPGENIPLVLDSADRLYLARYFRCENDIGEDLLRRSRGLMEVDVQGGAELLNRLFPEQDGVNWQKQAAALALIKQFTLISGGPGTGKTYTVARILALLQALAGKPLRVALTAPTGKAAVRLHESIQSARESMEADLVATVPEETLTIHRLLGVLPDSGRFRHHQDNRLHLDLLIVDEASMIDVPLMAGLVKALPARARLIMLGDREQLTSVEAGSLFGDICAHGETGWSPGLCRLLKQLTGYGPVSSTERETFADVVALLRESYRFREKSGVGELARAVRSGEREKTIKVLKEQTYGDLHFEQVAKSDFKTWLSGRLEEGFRDCFSASGPREALAALGRFRMLCAVREGVAGVSGVNRIAEQTFRRRGLIKEHENLYRGKPLMISSNHYGLQLFNGDTGILWPDEEGKLRAWFMRPDGGIRKVALSRLPDHETAYAITVHKAQGSEFTEVVFVLPRSDTRVLSRELIYTGITRAREKLTLCGDLELIEKSIGRRVLRYSGLRDKIWKGTD